MMRHDRILERKFYPEGATIFREGDDGSQGFIVQVGSVELSRRSKNGQLTVGRIGQNGVFGEMALIEPGNRLFTAKALTDTTVIQIRNGEFQSKLKAADPFVRAVVRVMARSLRDIDRLVSRSESVD
jgi:CRP/FNR family cyclic AMP-dependent transcriptional regulator